MDSAIPATTPFADALGTPLCIGDVVVFQHTTLQRQTRGAPRYVRARITGRTEKLITAKWLAIQQLERCDNAALAQPPHTHNWTPGLCVRVETTALSDTAPSPGKECDHDGQ